jgi:putative transposase
MSKSRHTEAQMIGALKQLEAGRKAEDVAREVGVSKHTIYAWKAKYGGMDVSEAQEAKQLRDENTKLKKLVVDLSLDKEMLKALIAKNGWSSSRSDLRLAFPLKWAGKLFLRRGCEHLKLDVTLMSAGPEFVGADRWGRLPGWHGTTPHVLFETGGGEDKDQADAACTDVLEAYPGLSREEDRASGMHVVFLVA